ncbi:MAG: hypothetical protein PVF49_13520 [Anaerolineales bacterium]|jgi:hypothetical protein
MTSILTISLWSGLLVLYIGFCGVMGMLIRRTISPPHLGDDRERAALFGLLIFLPSTIFVVNYAEWPLWLRLASLTVGAAILLAAWRQPTWLSMNLWGRAFGQRYFAFAMGLTVIWGITLAIVSQALTPALVSAAASVAGLLSLLTAPNPG